MLKREQWLDLARKLDWNFSYVSEREVFPETMSGAPWLDREAWQQWDEPYKTTFREYVVGQQQKDLSLQAIRDLLGRSESFRKLSTPWVNALKLHGATLALAEFAAVVGNLRGARFGRHSAWRTMSLFGAMDECRHTHIPLLFMHEFLPFDPQFDWVHKFYHTDNWVAIAGRHLIHELLMATDPLEYAVGTHFVFETGLTNLQFIGLSSLAYKMGDHMFQKMVNSIQTDEARHAQIGSAVLEILIQHDPQYVQTMLDKWFWRSWPLFAIITGFAVDYLTPLEQRSYSFKEFMEEWVINQYLQQLENLGMKKPWYWNIFLDALDNYHHMVYASAYTYRRSVWFDLVVPGPEERAWLRSKYPKSWAHFDKVWQQIDRRWQQADPGNEWAVHGTSIPAFCSLCQLVLCGGTPENNTANTCDYMGRKYIFCSKPCRLIFLQWPERYAGHLNLVDRVLAGQAPGNLLEMLTQYFQLDRESWGADIKGGNYDWIQRD